MWRKANLRRWMAAFRRNPRMSGAGFAVGLLYGAATRILNRLSGHGTAASAGLPAWQSLSPLVIAVLGIALFIWLSGTLRLPRKPGIIFVVCIFPGAMVELLLSVLISTIARTIA
jgi:hypothetical protein